MIHNFLNPEIGHLLRELVIIAAGLIIRYFEKKKITNNDQF